MQLRYVLATLAILAAAVITGCVSTQHTESQVVQSTQSQLIEEYYLKPATGSDATRLDTLEQEIIAANTRKVDLVRKDHIIDLRARVAQEDLVYQRNRTSLLRANLNFAVGKNDDALVKKAEAELKANQDEIENKQCIIEYLKPRKEVNKDEIALVDAELAAKVAEREYIRAKIARDNQDELLGPPKTDDDETKDTTNRINVEEYKNTMKARQLEQKEVKKTHAQNAGRLNATESCGFDEKDLDTPPQQIRFEQQQNQQQQNQQQQNQQQQNQQQQNQQQKKQTNNQPVQQLQQQVQIVAAGTHKIKLTESQK